MNTDTEAQRRAENTEENGLLGRGRRGDVEPEAEADVVHDVPLARGRNQGTDVNVGVWIRSEHALADDQYGARCWRRCGASRRKDTESAEG
jgi:hypothetical protein